jgi:hypothetical protein
MEKILKLQSQQGFTETSSVDPAVPGNQLFINSKLVDFIIPGSGTYDLSKSYININMNVNSVKPAGVVIEGELATDTAIYNDEIEFVNSTLAQNIALSNPCSVLVRNASITCANRGMVESIRRVNVLKSTMWNLENDIATQHDGLDRFGAVGGRRGPGNRTSSLLQIMGSNVDVNGAVNLSIAAQPIARDYRIPLADLFGVGGALWNGDVFGDTRIHLELQPNQLNIDRLGGNEDTITFDAGGQNNTFGAMQDYTAAGLGQLAAAGVIGSAAHPLVTEITYKDFQLNQCFYVGQGVNVALQVAGAPAVNTNQIITSIEYNSGTNATNPPAGSEFVRLQTRGGYANATAAAVDITNIRLKSLESDNTASTIRINRAEIVLSELPGVNGPNSIDYITYSTEEVQGNGQTTFNNQIIVEPNCQNLIICPNATSNITPDRAWTSYRLAINNVDVCGNRDVIYASPLHKDRIVRTILNKGESPTNLTLHGYQNGVGQNNGVNQRKLYPILETMPVTRTQKLVNMELSSAGAEDVIYFKELRRTI